MPFPDTLQLEETIMRKPLLLLSVVILFGYRLLPGAAALAQETAAMCALGQRR